MAPPSFFIYRVSPRFKMKVIFCQETRDINYLLSKSEARELKRNGSFVPILTAECGEFTFHLANSPRVTSSIKLTEPRNQQFLHYYTRISDSAYEELASQGRCGTRYGNSSKLNIIIDEEL